MFHRFHDRFGTAGLIIAVIALIAALGGTALAAGALTTKQKKEVTKIAKKYAGKPGAPGTNGTNGTNGEKGAQGEKGAKGDTGNTGNTGPQGPAGTTGAKGDTGAAGATGAKGDTGATGFSGFTATLPSGETETGTWAIYANAAGVETLVSVISFPIPLAASIEQAGFHITLGGTTECPGSVGSPEAASGQVCVYVNMPPGLENLGVVGVKDFEGAGNAVGRPGLLLLFESEAAGHVQVEGTWAVTAP